MDLSSVGGARRAAGRRRHRPGARDPERARALGVEEPRPRARDGVAREAGQPVRLLPRQLDRRRPATATCSCRPATRGRSTGSAGRPARCSGGSAASAATSRWAPGRSSRGSTTPACHAGGERISVFDDGAAPAVQPQSKVLLLGVDHVHRRVHLVRKFVHRPERLLARFMGNGQLLGDGGIVVGWGSEPYLTEFAPDGSIRFDAKLPHGGENYRAFRFPWVGRPSTPPALVRSPADGMLHASWNGATEVASLAAPHRARRRRRSSLRSPSRGPASRRGSPRPSATATPPSRRSTGTARSSACPSRPRSEPAARQEIGVT